MEELELEKTYLVKYLPDGLLMCEHKELLDIYIPEGVIHPKLRIRQKGSKYEITKKTPCQKEMPHNIQNKPFRSKSLSLRRWLQLSERECIKTRYLYDYNDHVSEIDVFRDGLDGLVLVDFEFSTVEEMKSFEIPDFCLADVTQEDFIAGGDVVWQKIFGYQ